MASQSGPSADNQTKAPPRRRRRRRAAAGQTAADGPGSENATLMAAGITGTFLALATILVLYVLVAVWPAAPLPPVAAAATPATTAPPAGGTTTATTIAVQTAPNPPVQLFGGNFTIEREARLFLVVALAGGLGGLVYALRSLAWYVGNRNLKYSWLLTYPLQPVVGAALATITYVVARGGLIVVTTQTSSDVVNPFGFAAIGGLVGLFSSQAAEWLKRIFEQVFTSAMKGKDAAVEITAFDPDEGSEGTPVVIHGTGFAGVQSVTFGGVEATMTQASDTELRVTVPKDAKPGPITVRTPAGTATSTRPFEVIPLESEEAAPGGEQVEAEAEEPTTGQEAATERGDQQDAEVEVEDEVEEEGEVEEEDLSEDEESKK
jgi:hypothetical protein